MDMPCNCPQCNEVVELNDMYSVDNSNCIHSMLCPDCYEQFCDEQDEDEDDDDYFERVLPF